MLLKGALESYEQNKANTKLYQTLRIITFTIFTYYQKREKKLPISQWSLVTSTAVISNTKHEQLALSHSSILCKMRNTIDWTINFIKILEAKLNSKLE